MMDSTGFDWVDWSDVGEPIAPGEYPFRDGVVRIGERELAIWKTRPEVRFTVTGYSALERTLYALGSYHSPDEDLP